MGMISNTLFRGFTFDGINSLDYDIYITGAGVYNAPVRSVEKIAIQGRSGDLTIDQGRFENITVTYAECGCFANTQDEFAEKVRAFRNALCSRIGYKRLTDDYNDDEYRLAIYSSGLEVDAIAYHTAGSFDIEFDCMPQRFLLSGETPRLMVQGMTPSATQTQSGSILTIESDGGDAVTSLIAQIEPVQAGSGDPSPTNVRAITGWTAATVNVAGNNLINQRATIDGTRTALYRDINYSNNLINRVRLEAGKTYTLSFDIYCDIEPFQISVGAGRGAYSRDIKTVTNLTSGRVSITFTPTETQLAYGDVLAIRAPRFATSTTFAFAITNMMLSTDGSTTYEPYKGNTVSVSFDDAGTVYGGTLDVVTGVLTVTHKMVDLGTLGWSYRTSYAVPVFYYGGLSDMPLNTPLLCEQYTQTELAPNSSPQFPNYGIYNRNSFTSAHNLLIRDDRYTDAESFKTAVSGVKLVYELATPQTYALTAQQVELLTGDNNVWADTGDITLTYGADPYKVVNPTLFASKPLLKVTGRGTLSVGDVTLTISGTTSQVLYIDFDIMEIYTMTGGVPSPANSLVTMSGYDYPVLESGATEITLGTGITQVVITPRWWRI